MARIPLQIAERRLDTGSVVQYPSGSPLGAAIEGAGNDFMQAAETVRIKDERKDAFTADIVNNEFRSAMAGAEAEAERGAAADGSGLHDGVYGQMLPDGGVAKPGSFDKLFDDYLARMPASQREQFAAKREAYRMQGSNRLAASQYNREQAWYKVEIQKAQNDIVNSIGLSAPDDQTFEQFRQQGVDLIRKSGLPALEKDVAEANWLAQADETLFTARLERDPEFAKNARAALGLGSVQSAPGGSGLVAAIKHVESGGDPAAVSGAGAAGIMQVMPDTAREIAAEIRDPNFKMAWSDASIREYLKDPAVGERYGTHYIEKMQAKYGGDTEAALIAYNGGSERADKWLAAGRDDSVLPKETRDYYKKVKAAMGATGRSAEVDFKVDGPRGGRVTFSGKGGYKGELGNRVSTAFSSLGIKQVNVTSGYRSPEHNAKVGGAKQSQHTHGNAMDIDVTGYSQAQRVRIIRALSAAGIGGLGIGNNIIHADIGNRRAWGYKTAAGGGAVPDWAKDAIDEHLAGKAVASGGAGGDPVYANIPFDRRQILANKADAQVKDLAVQTRSLIEGAITDGPVAMSTFGRYDGPVPTREDFTTAYGRDGNAKFDQFSTAMETSQQAFQMQSMSSSEINEFLASEAPKQMGIGAAQDQARYEVLTKAAAATLKARADDPAAYVQRTFPSVATAWENASSPQGMQAAIAASFAAQQQLGFETLRPLPKTVAADAVKSFNDADKSESQRVAEISNLVMSSGDPEQRRAIFQQMVEAGLPDMTEGAFAAMERGDQGAARRLMQAAMIDPSKLPGKAPNTPAEIDGQIQASIMDEGQIGDIFYGLGDGQVENFERARRDSKLLTNAVNLRVRNGEELSVAVESAAKDLFGDVKAVSGDGRVNAQIVLPSDADETAVLDGLAGQLPAVREALTLNLAPAGKVEAKDGSRAIFDAATKTYINDVIAEGYFRNTGGGYVFVDPFSGGAISGSDGKPLVFSGDSPAPTPKADIREPLPMDDVLTGQDPVFGAR